MLELEILSEFDASFLSDSSTEIVSIDESRLTIGPRCDLVRAARWADAQ